MPGHTVAVIRPDGTVCEPGEPGEIAVARPDPAMFLGYWNQPEATAAKFVGDWMTTGDQAVCDHEGYVSFIGRNDDIITSSGFRIGPTEIEECLLRHPAVGGAAAVGKPDPIRTEIVKAFVVLREGFGASAELADDIKAFVRTRLSAHEYPREVGFVPDLADDRDRQDHAPRAARTGLASFEPHMKLCGSTSTPTVLPSRGLGAAAIMRRRNAWRSAERGALTSSRKR